VKKEIKKAIYVIPWADQLESIEVEEAVNNNNQRKLALPGLLKLSLFSFRGEQVENYEKIVTEAFRPVKKALEKALEELAEKEIAATVRFTPHLGILTVVLEAPSQAMIWEEA
jgi:hypothetical protein